MGVLSNKIWFLILFEFILPKRVYNQTLNAVHSDPTIKVKDIKSELNKKLKERLNNYGSLRPNYQGETSSSESFNQTNSFDKVLNSNLEVTSETNDSEKQPFKYSFSESYKHPNYQPYSFTNFEDYMTKGKREYLDKCTKTPHDFVLVIDESSSISNHNWTRNVKHFVLLISSAIANLNAENNLSIVQYSDDPKMVMNQRRLNKSTLSETENLIERMFEDTRQQGGSNTGKALEFVRQRVLDPSNEFVMNITERSPPVDHKNKVVILFTDGAADDPDLALSESLTARYNGVELYIFGVGAVKGSECRKMVGCPLEGDCPNFLHADWNNVVEYLHKLVLAMCTKKGINAACLEKWSDFTECSARCGGGTRTAKFLGFTTVSEPTTGPDGVKGLTCEEQYRNVQDKVERCNEFPCPEVLSDVNDHLPENGQEVNDELRSVIYGKNGEHLNEPEKSFDLSDALRELEESENDVNPTETTRSDSSNTQRTVGRGDRQRSFTHESEVNERTNHGRNALHDLLNQNKRSNNPPFHLLGGSEHRNVQVERLLEDDEVPDFLKNKRTKSDKETQTEGLNESSTQTVSTQDRSSQTTGEVNTTYRDLEEMENDEEEETSNRHSDQRTKETNGTTGQPTTHPTEPSRHVHKPFRTHHQEMIDEKNGQDSPVRKNLKLYVTNIKKGAFKLLENERFKKLASVGIVILLSALSISLFSYIFLREKEPTPNLYDPSDQEFMNAGDGEDVEPSENYQVSNMEDGIWA